MKEKDIFWFINMVNATVTIFVKNHLNKYEFYKIYCQIESLYRIDYS
jgi:hypothetical protein